MLRQRTATFHQRQFCGAILWQHHLRPETDLPRDPSVYPSLIYICTDREREGEIDR